MRQPYHNQFFINTCDTEWFTPETEIWDGSTASAFVSGTISDPYLITNGAELSRLRNVVGLSNKHYKITNDIFLNINSDNYKNWGTVAPKNEWTPIGTTSAELSNCEIDGGGYTIFGLYINKTTSQYYSGLFGYIIG